MKIWELEENEQYTSCGSTYKRQFSKLFVHFTRLNEWRISVVDLFDLFNMDFTKIEKIKPKTEIVFHEYFNNITGELVWIKKDYKIKDYHKPTGETVTREIEL